jgi:hypothetical protein
MPLLNYGDDFRYPENVNTLDEKIQYVRDQIHFFEAEKENPTVPLDLTMTNPNREDQITPEKILVAYTDLLNRLLGQQ